MKKDAKEENCKLYSLETDNQRLVTKLVTINELHDFKKHPFKIEHDMQLFELMRSIEEKGVIVPLIVRGNPFFYPCLKEVIICEQDK